jgi:polyhydroxyalkanoate synthesis repressor PhaR
MPKAKKPDDNIVTIKKYANRRLYNTDTSSYVTLDHLATMVKDGTEFQVFDAKTGEEITKSVLTQIIFEEESKGQNLLPINFLRHLIQFYGDSMQVFVPSYLEMSIESFAKNQEEMRKRLQGAFGSNLGFKNFEEQIAENLSMFQETMRMFSPFAALTTPPTTNQKKGAKSEESVEPQLSEIEELKAQLDAIQNQLKKITPKD